MSHAEHLIENCIVALWEGRDVDEELEKPINQEMLRLTGIMPGDLYAMAQHVVYGLYVEVLDQYVPPEGK